MRILPSLLLLLCLSGRAAEHSSGPFVSITAENDSFLKTDRHYTHGTRLDYLHTANRAPAWVSNILHQGHPGLEVDSIRWGLTLGQNIFTPENLRARYLIRDDRPYAGWFYGGFMLDREGWAGQGRVAVRDHFGLDLGIVGPESLSEDTQVWWHDMVNATHPEGWRYQLRTEPGAVISLNRAWRFPADPEPGWTADVVPDVGLTLGNILTAAEVGTLFRAGWNLPGTPSPGGLYRTSLLVPHPRELGVLNWGVYAFGGADARVVGHNIFLDGNTWRRSHSVDKEWLVAEFKAGFAFWFSRVSFSATYIFRSREFEDQAGENQFASVTLGLQF